MEISGRDWGAGRNPAGAVILPIAGLIGGLILGSVRAKLTGMVDLQMLTCVVKWGVTGFFAASGLVLLMALQLRGRDAISIRRLMVLIAVVGVLTWFFGRVLFDAIGFGGF